MKKLILTVLIMIITTVYVEADVFIKTLTRAEPINAFGQSIPARETFSEQWISDNFYYIKSEEGFSYLYDIKKNIIYLIAHPTKSYLAISPEVDFTSLLPEEMAPMAQALKQMTISVTPTDEAAVINNIQCQGYRLEMVIMMYPIEMTIWASEELPVNLKRFLEEVWPVIMRLDLRVAGESASELNKIKGLWIAYESRAKIMGTEVNSKTEIVELSKKTPPKGTYALPEGYRQKDRLEMEDLTGL
jgi:hypothetical protein